MYFISRLFVIIIYVYFNTPDGDVFFFFVVYTKKITFDFIRFFFKKKKGQRIKLLVFLTDLTDSFCCVAVILFLAMLRDRNGHKKKEIHTPIIHIKVGVLK